jgi:6-phosphogluconate dehydrogenase
MNPLIGESRWTVEAAIEEAVAADVITAALFTRFRSRQDHTFGEKMLSAVRFGLGGQVEGQEPIDPEPKPKDAPRRAATQAAVSAAGQRRNA